MEEVLISKGGVILLLKTLLSFLYPIVLLGVIDVCLPSLPDS